MCVLSTSNPQEECALPSGGDLFVSILESCVCVLSTSNPQKECALPSGGDLFVSILEGFLCVCTEYFKSSGGLCTTLRRPVC